MTSARAEGANSIISISFSTSSSSMDQPSILVRILHAIPHVNYTFRRVNDTFNPDSDIYLESLGILASIPAALLILSLFGLLLYLLTRCCDRKPRKPSTQRCQNCTLVIITLMCCAAIGLGLYGNDDFHNGLLQAFSSGKQVEGLVGNLKKQTESIKINLETKVQSYNLEEQIDKSKYNQTAVTILLDTCRLVRDNTSRAVTSLDNMVLYFMKTKGTENDTSLKGVLHLGELYESIRWPATLGFLTLLLLLCTILVIGVARRSRCALIFFSVSGLFCIIICWLLSGIYLASSVAAGDFCMRPHEFMCRQVGMRSPYVYFLNCGTLRNRFILRLNESRDLVERARESVYLVSRMSQDVSPRIDIRHTLERMDNDLEETKRNLSVLSATLDRRFIDKHYADALRGLCGGGLLGLSLMMVAGLLTSFLLTILVYADSHAWIYLTKRPPMEADKSETTPLFPISSAPNASISPTLPAGTGTINRTLLHHQQAHSGTLSAGGGVGGTGGHHHRNGTAGLRSGLAYTATTSPNTVGGGDGNSSPPPGYDVVVHGTRSGHHTLGRLPSQQSAYLAGPNNGKYATLSKQCKTLESNDFY
ncbi:protein tweety-2-like isoform X1 [Episyrphus balteatus]|uniref:protein tweety-2-like isoform X1 n=1 Tax=Episyrphus balteatus TaxID=286459 RepID=UPI002485F46A|nr:protein tweety-2-like isoform X1 [Episyrphus balteatus]